MWCHVGDRVRVKKVGALSICVQIASNSSTRWPSASINGIELFQGLGTRLQRLTPRRSDHPLRLGAGIGSSYEEADHVALLELLKGVALSGRGLGPVPLERLWRETRLPGAVRKLLATRQVTSNQGGVHAPCCTAHGSTSLRPSAAAQWARQAMRRHRRASPTSICINRAMALSWRPALLGEP